MARVLGLWVGLMLCVAAAGAADMVQNGDFTQGVDAKGWPKGWACSGDSKVDQQLTVQSDPGPGGPCARLTCRAFVGGSPASHAMIAQSRTIALGAGKWYRISFRARQEGIRGGAILIGITDTKAWRETGIRNSIRVGRAWRPFTIEARSQVDVPAAQTRLQFWFTTTGTLFMDDVHVEQINAPRQVYAPLVATDGRKNLIPNSSFECGTAGWGGVSDRMGWGYLNELIGAIHPENARDGKNCLQVRIDKNTPTFYFDYFDLQRLPVKAPLAGNVGWIAVEKGADYTLSAWLRADRPDVRAVLSVYFGSSPATKPVTLTTTWQRYIFPLKAREGYCHIAIGPDLRQDPRPEATVWLDAVQFEKGAAPTDYAPADPVEVGVDTDKSQYVFHEGDRVELLASAFNSSGAPAAAKVSLRLEDFFDAPAGTHEVTLTPEPRQGATARLATGLTKKGFYRAIIRTEAGGRTRETRLRLAIIAPYQEQDSIFGMNHAHPWNSMIKIVKDAGIVWMRDWSFKWQFIEPQKGKFTFEEADAQIDRPLALGEKIDLLLPFPSANWSSGAPASVAVTERYPGNRERMAWRPRDPGEFADYVAACVNHTKNRTHTFEILNEPVYTNYALPRTKGHTVKDYLDLLKVAYAATKKADPRSFVIGGLASNGGNIALYEELIKGGGLDYLDALDIHVYPGLTVPEAAEEWLVRLNELMRAAGKVRPMWLTEYGYYADDEPSTSKKFEMPALESEKLCAAYYVRINTIMLANNVAKLFYHAGSSSRLNDEGLEGIFLRYGNAPRKMLTAQSAMANLLGASGRFVERLAAPEGLRAYLFETAGGTLLIAWAEEDSGGKLRLGDGRLQGLDIQGNEIAGRELALTEYPVYVFAPRLRPPDARSVIQVLK